MWTCPTCNRSFQKKGQVHTCKSYPLSEHFKGKAYAEKLFKELLVKLKTLGKIKVESLPCCIHLVKPENAFTFAAVYGLKDGLRFHIGLKEKIASPRVRKCAQTSSTTFMHEIDAKEIDKELLVLLKAAYYLK